ncbi:hypothetical protein BRC93_03495 [Halobacteriales archaeon QS_5_70_15]|nr:MAG: hypothetical protein BRC93_03495 [Halobacteriales archaeon QS_5_70_15]
MRHSRTTAHQDPRSLDRLDAVLSKVVDDGKLLTIQPGGNHGDSLIYFGFDKLLGTTDIDRVRLSSGRVRFDATRAAPSLNPAESVRWAYHQWKYARHRRLNDIDAIYIHGGGNFNDLWEVGLSCYRTAARYFDCPIVVGPQSCQFDSTDPADVFEQVSNETHFFCRESYSYDIIEAATDRCDHVEVYMDNDTALFLDADDLPVNASTEEYVLLAMRMDQDSSFPAIERDIPAPSQVNDISKMKDTFAEWVKAVARAEHVFTDRLHVAILGYILDKPITWYNTGYHKNRGVYEYSLLNEPGIEFVIGTETAI